MRILFLPPLLVAEPAPFDATFFLFENQDSKITGELNLTTNSFLT
jgi:hypothetical protein